MTRRLIVPLTMAIVTLHAGQGFAQGAFPAPLPGKAPAPSLGTTSVVAGATPFLNSPFAGSSTKADSVEECMNEFVPLREEAEKRGKLIKAASDRHAPPVEACKLIGNFGEAEIKMIKYVESHAANCEIPSEISDQLKNSHKNTEAMQQKVCAVAQQQQQRGPVGPLGDYWLPEEKL